MTRARGVAAAMVAIGAVLLSGAGGLTPARAVAATVADAATVRLAGPLSVPAPTADPPATFTIPLTVTNTGASTLYDLRITSLRSAPITTSAGLTTAFRGAAVAESGSTNPGPDRPGPAALAAGATVQIAYTVDTSSDPRTGICLCFLGVYALDVLVTAADQPAGTRVTVARTQTYLPSLLGVTAPVDVGWLWPLLDRPHRLTTGSVFADDALATAVGPGGRLDRALQVVESVDATQARVPGVARSLLLLLDPEIIDELVTMSRGYTVTGPDGRTLAGTGGAVATAWLDRLARVVRQHDVRFTAPSDPDLVGFAARGVAVRAVTDSATTARVATALGLPAGRPLPHDLAWPVGPGLDGPARTALAAAGATRVVTTAGTGDDGAVTALPAGTGGAPPVTALLADPTLSTQAAAAIGLGQDNSGGLQRLVVAAAMTSVRHPDSTRAVLVVPDRALDVAPAAATRAVLATASLGRPVSPLAAPVVGNGIPGGASAARPGPPPPALAAALDAVTAAARAADTVRAAVVSGADTVIGDLAERMQRAGSNSWATAPPAAAGRSTADLTARVTTLTGAVQVVVRASGNYSLASADAPLLFTVTNGFPVPVRIRIDVQAAGRVNGFEAGMRQTVDVAANSRPTIQVPTKVTRSGRFEATVTLRAADGAVIGSPARITVTSTAVGTVGRIVTYSAGALLLLALLVRGVRRWRVRTRAGSDGAGPDAADPGGGPPGPTRPDDTRPEEGRTAVPARES